MADIGVVVVTFNRLKKLKQALQSYEKQIYPPAYLLVVDNNSSDGTVQFLNNWASEPGTLVKKVILLPVNTGGSGGFYVGLECALEMKADWIWMGDDDAYPAPNSLYNVNQYIMLHNMSNISALCGKVITNKGIDTWHRRVLDKHIGILCERKINETEYNREFTLTFLSYVGCILSKNALLAIGLPDAEFFIAYDDSEHSYRLSKYGDIICLPDVSVYHDANEGEINACSWKQYYGIRNKVYSYRKHFGMQQAGCLAVYYFLKNFSNPIRRKLTTTAIIDAYRGILGKHKIYHPGWKG